MGYYFSLADAKRLGSPVYRCADTTKYVEEVADYIITHDKFDTFVKGEDVSKEAMQMYSMYLGLSGVLALELFINSDKTEAKLKLYIQTLKFSDEYQQYLTYRHGKTVILTVPYEKLFLQDNLESAVYKVFIKELEIRKLQWWLYFKTCRFVINELLDATTLVGYRFDGMDYVSKWHDTFSLDMSCSDFVIPSQWSHGKYINLTEVDGLLQTPNEFVTGKQVFDVTEYDKICEVLKYKAKGAFESERVYDITTRG